MVTSVEPVIASPLPLVTTMSHKIITVVSLSGVNSSTNMSVGATGKEMSSRNLTRLPIYKSVVVSYGDTLANTKVTFCGAAVCLIKKYNVILQKKIVTKLQ